MCLRRPILILNSRGAVGKTKVDKRALNCVPFNLACPNKKPPLLLKWIPSYATLPFPLCPLQEASAHLPFSTLLPCAGVALGLHWDCIADFIINCLCVRYAPRGIRLAIRYYLDKLDPTSNSVALTKAPPKDSIDSSNSEQRQKAPFHLSLKPESLKHFSHSRGQSQVSHVCLK